MNNDKEQNRGENLLEARKIAAEYGTLDSQIDSGNLYFALSKCLEHIDAQPAQEPVAWMTINAYDDEDDIWYENPEGKLLEGWTYKPLYTYPPTVQPEKEPLEYWNAVEGWVKIGEVREHFDSVGCGTIYKTAGEDRVPVYTTSQKRPWVGLTEDELLHIGVATGLERAAAQMIADKLKEKNL